MSPKDDRALTAEEHAARAMLMSGNHGGNLWYDAYTNTYRPRSPAGHAYKYSGCLDADTLEPLGKGQALEREKTCDPKRPWGVGNGVCTARLGVKYDRPPKR